MFSVLEVEIIRGRLQHLLTIVAFGEKPYNFIPLNNGVILTNENYI